jgi:hypothetical protein
MNQHYSVYLFIITTMSNFISCKYILLQKHIVMFFTYTLIIVIPTKVLQKILKQHSAYIFIECTLSDLSFEYV